MNHHKINYLEIPTVDIVASKRFFQQVFGWSFQDYGPEYSCFLEQGIDGGFFQAKSNVDTGKGAPLVVIYSADLDTTKQRVIEYKGSICKDTFSFPGGQRFHFQDPAGNEFAVWSE